MRRAWLRKTLSITNMRRASVIAAQNLAFPITLAMIQFLSMQPFIRPLKKQKSWGLIGTGKKCIETVFVSSCSYL